MVHQIWSSSSSTVQSRVLDTGLSEHGITFAFIPSSIKRKLTHETFRDHSENCLEHLEISQTINLILSETFKPLWDECSNFNEKLSLISSQLHKVFDSCFTFRTKVVSSISIPPPFFHGSQVASS